MIANRFLRSIFQCQSQMIYLANSKIYKMASFTDRMADRQGKKAQQEFKKQIEHMANKPTFTLMDYKQRVIDQLNNLKSSIRKKMSQQSKQTQKALQKEKKIMNALFPDELNGQVEVNDQVRKQIATISQVPIQQVRQTLRKAQSYKKMHKFLRSKHLAGEPLPESMAQLQYQFKFSKYQLQGKQKLFTIRKQNRHEQKGYFRAKRARYIKFQTNQ